MSGSNDQSGANDRDYVQELKTLLADIKSPFLLLEYKGDSSGKIGLSIAADSTFHHPDKIFWNHIPDAVNKTLGEPLFTSYMGDTNMTGESSDPGIIGTIGALLSPAYAMALAITHSERDYEYLSLIIEKADLQKVFDNPNFSEIRDILASPYRETADRTEGFTGIKLKAAALLLESKDSEKDRGVGGRG